MAYVASNIGTIPGQGFNWYMVFLESAFEDDLRKEIENHFVALGQEAGEKVLVVRVFDAKKFGEPFTEAGALFEERFGIEIKCPALLIMNRPPEDVLGSDDRLETTKVISFPLRPVYEKNRTIVPFLEELCRTLGNPEALKLLDDKDRRGVKKFWAWLTKYAEIKPSVCGVRVDLGKAVTDLIGKKAYRLTNALADAKGAVHSLFCFLRRLMLDVMGFSQRSGASRPVRPTRP